MMKKVYVCEDNVTGIFSAVYDAWKEERRIENTGIAIKGMLEQELFCDYVESVSHEKKAVAVENLIKKHMGYEAYWDIHYAVLASDREKGTAILGTMLAAKEVSNSRRIMEHLSNPYVEKVFELRRNVANEAHRFKEFLRFRELENGVLLSEIEPKSQVLTCIADHFQDRLPLENWMVYDRTHQMFLVHQAKKQWVLVLGEKLNIEEASNVSRAEQEFSHLWKGFFESIAIEERCSEKRQRQMLPLRFRQDMVEFQR